MTKAIGRESSIVKEFCKRIEERIQRTVERERTTDRTLIPAITFFRKIHKKKRTQMSGKQTNLKCFMLILSRTTSKSQQHT